MGIFGNLFDFNGDGHMSIAEQAADYIAFRNITDSSCDFSYNEEFSFDDDLICEDTGDYYGDFN